MKAALSQAVSIVEQHIAAAYPNSPAGLLASDSTIRVALGRDASLGEKSDSEFVKAIDTKNGGKPVQEATKAVLTEMSNDERNNGSEEEDKTEGIAQGVEAARKVLTAALLTQN